MLPKLHVYEQTIRRSLTPAKRKKRAHRHHQIAGGQEKGGVSGERGDWNGSSRTVRVAGKIQSHHKGVRKKGGGLLGRSRKIEEAKRVVGRFESAIFLNAAEEG